MDTSRLRKFISDLPYWIYRLRWWFVAPFLIDAGLRLLIEALPYVCPQLTSARDFLLLGNALGLAVNAFHVASDPNFPFEKVTSELHHLEGRSKKDDIPIPKGITRLAKSRWKYAVGLYLCIAIVVIGVTLMLLYIYSTWKIRNGEGPLGPSVWDLTVATSMLLMLIGTAGASLWKAIAWLWAKVRAKD